MNTVTDIQIETEKSEQIVDRIVKRFELGLAHHFNHQDELYRPYLKLAALVYVISLAYSGWAYGQVMTEFGAEALLSITRQPIILVGHVFRVILLTITALVRDRMDKKQETGITLFAIFLVMNLLSGHFFLFVFGLYALFNLSMQESVSDWAPSWYRSLIKTF